jgi:hypothetical protein
MESSVSDIPAGDGKTANLFLQWGWRAGMTTLFLLLFFNEIKKYHNPMFDVCEGSSPVAEVLDGPYIVMQLTSLSGVVVQGRQYIYS